MFAKTASFFAVAAIGLMSLSCTDMAPKPDPAKPKAKSAVSTLPVVTGPHRVGTVAEFAALESSANVQVSGYGIVVGLGKNGSSEVPAQAEKYLKEQIKKSGMSSYRNGTQDITPDMILRDKDTAAVIVGATIPAMAPVGTRFDVYVNSLPGTQTVSLDGGFLMLTDLFLAPAGVALPSGGSKAMAKSRGNLFVNPFLDPTNPKDQTKLREGRIINGGMVTFSAPLKLILFQPDFARCSLIKRRINDRFPNNSGPVANATSTQVVDLTVPKAYTNDYEHFLELVMHLPLASGTGVWEARAKTIAQEMESPQANHYELALVWEAMGKTVLPIVKNSYASKNPTVAYYAAVTGLRMGDDTAIDLVLDHAQNANSPMQMNAIKELGRTHSYQGMAVLQKLIDSPNDQVRLAAYQGLVKLDDREVINRIEIPARFYLDLVKTKRPPMIYATQTGQARIVIFGDKLTLQPEIFFNSFDDLVRINSSPDHKTISIDRSITGTTRRSPAFKTDYSVASLVQILGNPPVHDDNGKVQGLNISYGQIVSILYRMCKQKDIPANFVLQQMPSMQKIYEGAPSSGRPDMPPVK